MLPSSHEGLPIALLEAMSYRLPVIVSDIPANKEMGLDASCYFETGNIEQLADRLQEIIDGDFKQVHYDMEKYGWDYDTGNYFINITIFPWLEVGYTCTLHKAPYGSTYYPESVWGKYCNQDRQFSGRLRLWKEGWWKE